MQLMQRKEVLEWLGVSQSTLRLMVLKKGFPAPLKPSYKKVFWIKEEIDQWLVEEAQRKNVAMDIRRSNQWSTTACSRGEWEGLK